MISYSPVSMHCRDCSCFTKPCRQAADLSLREIQLFACQMVHQEIGTDAHSDHQDRGVEEEMVQQSIAADGGKSGDDHEDGGDQGYSHLDTATWMP